VRDKKFLLARESVERPRIAMTSGAGEYSVRDERKVLKTEQPTLHVQSSDKQSFKLNLLSYDFL